MLPLHPNTSCTYVVLPNAPNHIEQQPPPLIFLLKQLTRCDLQEVAQVT